MQMLSLIARTIGYLIIIFLGLCILDVFIALFLVLVRSIVNMFRRKNNEKDNI